MAITLMYSNIKYVRKLLKFRGHGKKPQRSLHWILNSPQAERSKVVFCEVDQPGALQRFLFAQMRNAQPNTRKPHLSHWMPNY